jgi:pimeloyl-ACP methyl ester carboxylesterase
MTRVIQGAAVLLAGGIAALVISARGCATGSQLPATTIAAGSAIVTIHPASHARGVIATSGGWAYCQQVRSLARRFHYTLVCGAYPKDGYTERGLRRLRHLDWGNPTYLDDLARVIREVHRESGGPLVLLGVSYSGFGVATLASHHPELRPDRLIVIDSYMDLVARRRHSPEGSLTATEIDAETGGSNETALRRRSVRVDGLLQLVKRGTELVPIWTISDQERDLFRGATCDRTASARTLSELARRLDRSLSAWITNTKHGHNLWDRGREIMRGHYPGTRVLFPSSGAIPARAVC